MPDGTITRRRLLQGASAGVVGAAAGTGAVNARELAGYRGSLARQTPERAALSVSTAETGGYAAAESTPSLNMPEGDRGTIEFWMKHRGTSDEDAVLVMKNSEDEHGYGVALDGTGEDRPVTFGWKYPNSNNYNLTSNSGIPAHTWTHVACVYDGNQLAIYIDGETDATYGGWDGDSMNGNDRVLRLGANEAGNGRFYDGQLDDVRIWNRARTQIEINETMNATLTGDEDDLVAYYSFDGGATDLARSNDLELAGTAELVPPGALPVTPSLYSRAGNGGVELQWTDRGEGAAEFTLYHGTAFDGSDAQQVGSFGGDTTSTTVNATNDQVHYFWLTAVDDSGNESDVSYPAIAYPSATPSGNALSFPGDNSYVEISDRPRFDAPAGNRGTIEFWVKHQGESDENAALVMNNLPDQHGYGVFFEGTGAEPAVKFGWKYPNSNNYNLSSEFGVPADTWTHVACVYDGSQLAIYLDGELDATYDGWDDDSMKGNTAPLMLGATAQKNERFFAGQLDQIRIWDVARTQEDIQENYDSELFGNEEGLLGYFRTCDGEFLQGSVGVGQSGTLNNVQCGDSDIELENEVEGSGGTPAGGGGGESDDDVGGNVSDTGGGGFLAASNSSNEAERGFFTNGENSPSRFLNRNMLTVLGIVVSILSIIYEMAGGGR